MDTYRALAFVGEFTQQCCPLLWMDLPTPMSVMLRPKSVSDSVEDLGQLFTWHGSSHCWPGMIYYFQKSLSIQSSLTLKIKCLKWKDEFPLWNVYWQARLEIHKSKLSRLQLDTAGQRHIAADSITQPAKPLHTVLWNTYGISNFLHRIIWTIKVYIFPKNFI